MTRITEKVLDKDVYKRLLVALLALMIVLPSLSSGQTGTNPPDTDEGCLLYRSPISGTYDQVPLLHTDVALDVRGLVASATVTQQYANSSTAADRGRLHLSASA